MKNKNLYIFLKSASVIVIFCFLFQQAAYALPSGSYYLRTLAFAEKDGGGAAADAERWDEDRVDSYMDNLAILQHEIRNSLTQAYEFYYKLGRSVRGFSQMPQGPAGAESSQLVNTAIDQAKAAIDNWGLISKGIVTTPEDAQNMGAQLTMQADAAAGAISVLHKQLIMFADSAIRAAPKGKRDAIQTLAAALIAKTSFTQDRIVGFIKTNGKFDTHGEPSPINIGASIEFVIDYYKTSGVSQSLVFSFDEEASLPLVSIDWSLAIEVWDNLIRNAARAVNEARLKGIPLAISVRQEQDSVVIVLADQGPGFRSMSGKPLEGPNQVFEKGYTTRKNGKGRGLGLWIVSEIIRNAGGNIRAEFSDANKKTGATFIIRLPVAPPMASTAAPALLNARIANSSI